MSPRPVALITGAASGLGWALSRALAPHCDLLMTDINGDLLRTKAGELSQPFVAADLVDADELAHLVAALEARFERLDFLINCAGITHRSLAQHTDPQVIQQVMAVNYQAPVNLALACLPQLKRCGGKIVNISSMAGWMPVLGRAGYCAAKSALHQFFETLRCEIRAEGVRVLMVYPSFLDTAIEANALGGDGKPARHPRSIIGTPRTPEWMANRIWSAMQRSQERLYPDPFTRLAALLYALAPAFFLRAMTRKFASELTASTSSNL
ncbi:SDR family NAD(P)-dependent oxidoreductase [Simiduia aestuariiviva]|uniref:NAD(P)-dependent dehydrogenase (Short-subunit alcohol dehydrogenase family) n=1 Tax=Simiduia aestuariiviva TaxID=1510459 RepID=A0A839UQ85_9GAMM|nr:NAD(P)-dependent dehydrogenase (short-subunit alcohol dehydrogenase family) [Simiduia aestuariiviva]